MNHSKSTITVLIARLGCLVFLVAALIFLCMGPLRTVLSLGFGSRVLDSSYLVRFPRQMKLGHLALENMHKLICDVDFKRVTSQGCQDGVLQYIFDQIGTENKFFVEFGFDAGTHEGGSGSNTFNLKTQFGWHGLLMDGSHDNPGANLHQELIFPENIVTLLEKYGVPPEVDYISVDLDSWDLWVFDAILSSGKFRPRVVSVEYDVNFPTLSNLTDTFDHTVGLWIGDKIYGASIGAYNVVAKLHGYSIVYVVDRLDVFLVRNDLLEKNGAFAPPLETFEEFGRSEHKQGMHGYTSAEKQSMLMDVAVWVDTKSVEKSQAAAQAYLRRNNLNFVKPA